jgi:SAM-dependent methyltransferase
MHDGGRRGQTPRPSAAPGYEPRLYAAVHDGTPGDLAFYRRVCADAGSVLELGCGYGRVLESLVGRVPRLVGLDCDPDLLALAAERLEDAPVDLVAADMRAFDLDARFERIIIPHSGLFCLLDDAALDACLRRVHRHLEPGGLLALDVYGTDGLDDDAEEDGTFESEDLVFVKRIEIGPRRWDVYERSTWEPGRQRIDATYVHVPDDDGPPVEGVIRQRYLLPAQIEAAITRAKLEIIEMHSSFESPDDDIIALVARRPDA